MPSGRSPLESLLAVDEAVAAILATLEERGLTDNTLVVFTSDNGIMWQEHWWASKRTAYEESIRVPLVARYPALVPLAIRVDDLVLNLDLAPTLAELAGLDVPSTVDGRSLVGLLRDGAPWREDFLIENAGRFIFPRHAGVRSREWKFVQSEVTAGVAEELYDLVADPYELENRAADPAYTDVRSALAARLDALQAE